MFPLITPSLKLKCPMLYEKVHIPFAYRTNFNNSEKLLNCGSFSHTWDLSKKPSSLGAVQVKGMRFVIFWFRRYEKIVLERRLKKQTVFWGRLAMP